MFFKGIFSKKLSISRGIELLSEYCKENGFDKDTQWKKTTHSKGLFAYHKHSHKMVSNNWVSCHPSRGAQKYSVWIDLISKDITEIAR